MLLITTVLAEVEELAPLLFPPIVFALIAIVLFVALAFVTWSFRDVANRYAHKVGTAGHDAHDSGH